MQNIKGPREPDPNDLTSDLVASPAPNDAKALLWYSGRDIQNYTMVERTAHSDFGIRNQDNALPNLAPHRHEYFQIHAQISGSTTHHIGSAARPVTAGTICFILPYKVHFIPTAPNSEYYIINASQSFLMPGLDVDPLDLEDVSIEQAPELAPFKYQEYLDFIFEDDELATLQRLCRSMLEEAWISVSAPRCSAALICTNALAWCAAGLVRSSGISLSSGSPRWRGARL